MPPELQQKDSVTPPLSLLLHTRLLPTDTKHVDLPVFQGHGPSLQHDETPLYSLFSETHARACIHMECFPSHLNTLWHSFWFIPTHILVIISLLSTGHAVPGFKTVRQLGEGGFGVVYLTEREKDKKASS
jgi:hypothetical protein